MPYMLSILGLLEYGCISYKYMVAVIYVPATLHDCVICMVVIFGLADMPSMKKIYLSQAVDGEKGGGGGGRGQLELACNSWSHGVGWIKVGSLVT